MKEWENIKDKEWQELLNPVMLDLLHHQVSSPLLHISTRTNSWQICSTVSHADCLLDSNNWNGPKTLMHTQERRPDKNKYGDTAAFCIHEDLTFFSTGDLCNTTLEALHSTNNTFSVVETH